MKKLSFKRIKVGPAEAGLASVALIVAGFMGYQFSDIRDESADTVANSEEDIQAEQAQEIVVKEEKPQEEVNIPAEEEAAEPLPEPEDSTRKTQVDLEAKTVQSGDTITASVSMGESLTGTCKFEYAKTGYETIEKRVTVNRNNLCETTLSKTQDFGGVEGAWEYTVTFVGKKNYEGQSITASFVIN